MPPQALQCKLRVSGSAAVNASDVSTHQHGRMFFVFDWIALETSPALGILAAVMDIFLVYLVRLAPVQRYQQAFPTILWAAPLECESDSSVAHDFRDVVFVVSRMESFVHSDLRACLVQAAGNQSVEPLFITHHPQDFGAWWQAPVIEYIFREDHLLIRIGL